ncbi:MAG: DNA repair protein RecN [Calditrichales bacterium]|nr:DNA repair protein RecN [Calditrichales bacterium]
MIKSLYIKNFALVDEIKIDFRAGLNIITGETGAGKSIIVNALGQLCGGRSSADLIRAGEKKAVIEAHIDAVPSVELKNLTDSLELDIEDFHSIVFRKEINANGTARIFINDSPVTLARLNQLSSLLIDFHGQYQHQRLLHPENHIFYLDEFGSLSGQINDFSLLLNKYNTAVKKCQELKASKLRAFQMQDMYRYQHDELTNANLDAGEIDNLKSEMRILANVESLHQYGKELTDSLYSGETNAGQLLADAEENLNNLAELDDHFSGLCENLSAAREAVEEIGRFTEQYLSNLQFNPERMEFIHQRIAQLEFLLKKYQKLNIQELINLQEEIGRLLGDMEQFDDEIKDKEKEIVGISKEIVGLGKLISQRRKETAEIFQQKITGILYEIGMPHAQFLVWQDLNEQENAGFVIDGKKAAANRRGFDQIIFEITTNAGEKLKPLHKTASGGEISRIMLALKSVLAEADKTPSLIFDEIDSGISGKTAQIVGRKMVELARYHQIVCVTHLPQIAVFARCHYKVAKFVEEKRTFINISLLDNSGQINEVANLLGGKDISQQALENARHLIYEAKNLQI